MRRAACFSLLALALASTDSSPATGAENAPGRFALHAARLIDGHGAAADVVDEVGRKVRFDIQQGGGDLFRDISELERMKWVMKGGKIHRDELER